VPTAPLNQADADSDKEGGIMWFVIGGFAALLWLILLISLGIATIRKGHWVMFILGLFLPIFWIIGAMMAPTTAQPA
jgi:hypothetical protein